MDPHERRDGARLLALDRPRDALAVLRDAYTAPLDAMALAFRRAGEADSAAVYAGYARLAWDRADPEVKQLLRALD